MEHLGLGRLYNVPRLNLNYVCICAARNNAKHDSSPYWSILMYIYICIWQLSEFMGFVRCPNLRLELDDLSEVSRVKPSWWLDICQPFLFLAQKLI